MRERIKKFVAKIRRADEATKQKWFWGSSAAAVLIVLGLWLVYISNFTAAPFSKKESAGNEESSFIGTFKKGIQSLSDGLKTRYGNLKKNLDTNIGALEKRIGETNTIMIDSGAAENAPQGLENTTTTPLP